MSRGAQRWAAIAALALGAGPAWGQLSLEEARLKAMMTQEDQLAAAMETLDREILGGLQAQADLRAQAEALEAEVVEATEDHERLSETVAAKRAQLKVRLRARGQGGQAGLLKVLLSAETPTDLVRRQIYLQRIVSSDLRLMASLSADERALAAAAEQRQQALDSLGQIAEAERQRAESLEIARRLKSQAMRRVRQERRLMRQVLRQQHRAREAISGALTDASLAQGAGGLADERGRLPWPVPGDVIRGFGLRNDPELGTRVLSKGLEIGAPAEAPVRAIYEGTVAYAGWYKGFGNLVILDHGERHHTLYAHLAEINQAKGARVSQGEIIGRVGDTASLRGPMLYFEIRVGGEAQDPAEWLRAQ